jgi:hypothetical protein
VKKVYEYSHLGGAEILQVRYPQINREIEAVIQAVDVTSKTKESKESGRKAGLMLYSPKEMNRQ